MEGFMILVSERRDLLKKLNEFNQLMEQAVNNDDLQRFLIAEQHFEKHLHLLGTVEIK